MWLLGALTAFGPLSIDMYLPALPSMARSLGAAPSLTQLTLSPAPCCATEPRESPPRGPTRR